MSASTNSDWRQKYGALIAAIIVVVVIGGLLFVRSLGLGPRCTADGDCPAPLCAKAICSPSNHRCVAPIAKGGTCPCYDGQVDTNANCIGVKQQCVVDSPSGSRSHWVCNRAAQNCVTNNPQCPIGRQVLENGAWSVCRTTVNCSGRAMCGNEGSVSPPARSDTAQAGAQVVYLNFDNASFTAGELGDDNAKTNTISFMSLFDAPSDCIAEQPKHACCTPGSVISLDPFAWNFLAFTKDQAMSQVVCYLQLFFVEYNVQFVTSRPANGDYTMVIFGGHPADVCSSDEIASGIAHTDAGHHSRNHVAFVFNDLWRSPKDVAQAAAHELGHTFGLEHVAPRTAIMDEEASGDQWVIGDVIVNHQRVGRTQDDRSILSAALGLAQNPTPTCDPDAGLAVVQGRGQMTGTGEIPVYGFTADNGTSYAFWEGSGAPPQAVEVENYLDRVAVFGNVGGHGGFGTKFEILDYRFLDLTGELGIVRIGGEAGLDVKLERANGLGIFILTGQPGIIRHIREHVGWKVILRGAVDGAVGDKSGTTYIYKVNSADYLRQM